MTGRTTARRSCRLGRDHSFAVDAAPKGRSAVVAISGSVGYDSPLARAIAFTFHKGRRCTNAHDPDRPLSPSSRPARHPPRRGRRAGRQRGTRSEIRHQQGELPRPPTGALIVLSESLAFPDLEGARGHLGSALLRTRYASLTAGGQLPPFSPVARPAAALVARPPRPSAPSPGFPREEDQLLARFRLTPADASGESDHPRPAAGATAMPIGHPGCCLDRRRERASLCPPPVVEGRSWTSPSRRW